MASADTQQWRLVVGLGNPGKRYENTRHNVGFDVVAELARRHSATRPRAKFQGELSEAIINGRRTLLLCPLTFMNRSGASVQPARDFYKLDAADVLVVCDDFALPLAKLRFRPSGSSGGQKGLNDIIQRLGTDLPRLRLGIGPLPENWDVADFVLSKFKSDDRQTIDQAVARAADGVADWVSHDIQYCMNQYNAN
jgi:PTH1 family peptidyl-tRNA hydrolase